MGFISVTVHICDSGNVHQILLFRYFREELKQRGMGKGFVPGRPHSILLSYNWAWSTGRQGRNYNVNVDCTFLDILPAKASTRILPSFLSSLRYL